MCSGSICTVRKASPRPARRWGSALRGSLRGGKAWSLAAGIGRIVAWGLGELVSHGSIIAATHVPVTSTVAHMMIEVPGVDIGLVLRPLAMLWGDPTIRMGPGLVERATWTPEGPGSIRVTWGSGERAANVEAFGDGGNWLIERAPQFLGATDDPAGFNPASMVVKGLWASSRPSKASARGRPVACQP